MPSWPWCPTGGQKPVSSGRLLLPSSLLRGLGFSPQLLLTRAPNKCSFLLTLTSQASQRLSQVLRIQVQGCVKFRPNAMEKESLPPLSRKA